LMTLLSFGMDPIMQKPLLEAPICTGDESKLKWIHQLFAILRICQMFWEFALLCQIWHSESNSHDDWL
jgi:hypothetical protein